MIEKEQLLERLQTIKQSTEAIMKGGGNIEPTTTDVAKNQGQSEESI